MKSIKKLLLPALFVMCSFASSCDDWNEPRTIGLELQDPEAQDPALYEAYMQSLRAYKQTSHPLVFASLENAPDVSFSEKDFMRALPDSLDMVVLKRAERLTAYDKEDMPLMKRKGTRVLYYIDLVPFEGDLSWGAVSGELQDYIDKAAADYAQYGFDGFAVAGNVNMGADAASQEEMRAAAGRITDMLLESVDEGDVLLFEGSPLYFDAQDRNKYDYFVAPREGMKHILEADNTVNYYHDRLGVPLSKIMLSGTPSGTITGRENKLVAMLPEMAALVIASGELAGVGVYDAAEDYYDAKMNYSRTKQLIEILNPSH